MVSFGAVGLAGLTVLALLVNTNAQNKPSPCPQRFKYVGNPTPSSWSGELLIRSDVDLIDGVFLAILFDKPIKKLGSTFGKQIIKRTEFEYFVRNFGYSLDANKLLTIKIDVEFDPLSDPPNLAGYRLNAISWCPDKTELPPPEVSGSTTNVDASKLQELFLQFLNNNQQVRPQQPQNPSFGPNPGNFPFIQGGFGSTGNYLSTSSGSPFQQIPQEDGNKCGVPSSGTGDYGLEATKGEFPWHAGIFIEQPSKIDCICGGTLIWNQHVLTSARCVRNINPRHLKVSLGATEIFDFSPNVQRIGVRQIIQHPAFVQTEQAVENDLAILVLAQPAKLSPTVRTVCLWGQGVVPISGGVVPGFGLSDPEHQSSKLGKTHLPVLQQDHCSRANSKLTGLINENTICAGFDGISEPCGTDRGSGLVHKNYINPGKFVYELRGVATSGAEEFDSCPKGDFAVFTDLAKYGDWILNTINSASLSV